MTLARQLTDEPAPYAAGRQHPEKVRRMDEHRDHFARVPNAIAQDCTLDVFAFRFYVIVLTRDWKARGCHRSYAEMAAEMGCSRRRAILAAQECVRRGLIRAQSNGDRVTQTFYALPQTGEPNAPASEPNAPDGPELVQGVHQLVNVVHHPSAPGAPNKERDDLRDRESTIVLSSAEGGTGAHSDEQARSRTLCETIGIPGLPLNLTAMDGVIDRWAARCEKACDGTLEEKALDARAWLESPRNLDRPVGKRRTATVAFFRTWVKNDTDRAEARPPVTAQSQNGHYNSRAAPPVPAAIQSERDQRQHERREKHFKRYGTYDGFD